jgi:hypothetical protein
MEIGLVGILLILVLGFILGWLTWIPVHALHAQKERDAAEVVTRLAKDRKLWRRGAEEAWSNWQQTVDLLREITGRYTFKEKVKRHAGTLDISRRIYNGFVGPELERLLVKAEGEIARFDKESSKPDPDPEPKEEPKDAE